MWSLTYPPASLFWKSGANSASLSSAERHPRLCASWPWPKAEEAEMHRLVKRGRSGHSFPKYTQNWVSWLTLDTLREVGVSQHSAETQPLGCKLTFHMFLGGGEGRPYGHRHTWSIQSLGSELVSGASSVIVWSIFGLTWQLSACQCIKSRIRSFEVWYTAQACETLSEAGNELITLKSLVILMLSLSDSKL